YHTDEGQKGDIEYETRWVRSIYREDYAHSGVPFRAEGMIPVARSLYDEGLILVGLADDKFGRVFHFGEWARSLAYTESLEELAPSFAELPGRLIPDPED